METRLRNSILTFVDIGTKLSYLKAFANYRFQPNDLTVIVVKNIISISSYFNIRKHSSDGVFIGLAKSNEVLGEVYIRLTTNHKMIAKISFLDSKKHPPGMRGVVFWLKSQLGSMDDVENFIKWFELLNLSLI